MAKNFTTNNFLSEIFFERKITQIEFGHLTDTNKNSIHDWIKHKNEIRFSKLEEVVSTLGYEIEIVIKKIPTNQ